MKDTMTDFFSSLSLLDGHGQALDLSDRRAYRLEGVDGFGLLPFQRRGERSPQQPGESDAGFRLEPRRVTLRLKVRARSPAGYYAARAALLRFFQPADRPLVLQVGLPDGSRRALDVFFVSGLALPTWARRGLLQAVELNLRAPDPTFYDPAARQLAFPAAQDPALCFPAAFPLHFYGRQAVRAALFYQGSWESYPLLAIRGPLEDPTVCSETTGERLAFSYHLAPGETAAIDCRWGCKTAATSFGANLLPYLSPDSALDSFHLAPDPASPLGLNILVLSGAGAAAATALSLTYYDRYLGI